MPRRLEALHRLRTTASGHTILSLYGLQAANYLLPLASFPYLTRTLGPDGFGLYVFVLVVARYLILVTDLRLHLLGRPGRRRRTPGVPRRRRDLRVDPRGAALPAGRLRRRARDPHRLRPAVLSRRRALLDRVRGVAGSTLFPVWLYQGFERLPVATGCNIAFRAVARPDLRVRPRPRRPRRARLAVVAFRGSRPAS